jgi:putative SOS response-associated peptidase YedK
VGAVHICNLYTVRAGVAEVAAHFGIVEQVTSNAPDNVYPGAPGMVVREEHGHRILQSMAWGLAMASMEALTALTW